MLSSSVLTQIKSIFNKVEKNEEFEVMFNNYKSDNQLSIVKWMDVIKYLRWRSDDEKLKISNEDVSLDSLDIHLINPPEVKLDTDLLLDDIEVLA